MPRAAAGAPVQVTDEVGLALAALAIRAAPLVSGDRGIRLVC